MSVQTEASKPYVVDAYEAREGMFWDITRARAAILKATGDRP